MSEESSMSAERAKRQVEELLRPWDTVPKPSTSAYIRELNAGLERQRAEEERAKAERAAKAESDLAPLDDRLKKLISKKYSLDEQRAGLSLPLLQESLRGRQRQHAAASEIGAALRRAGFVRVRRWTGPDGFRAVWRKAP